MINKEVMPGTLKDLPEIIKLYNELNDALATGVNYPGWKKHIYPNEETAREGVTTETIYVMKDDNRVIGTVILNDCQPEEYSTLQWTVVADYKDVAVVHTLAVHPDYFKCGIARELMKFAEDLACKKHTRAIRLDVSVHNLPAIKLYEKCGYTLIGEVDLGLNIPGLELFKCYEKVICHP